MTARKLLTAAVFIGAMLGTMVVYGVSRDFSFFLDDAFDLTRVEASSSWEILTRPFPDYGYYRPVTFIIFNESFELFGEHNTRALRSLLLLIHAFSAGLLYLLVRRLTGSEWAIAASALFLVFPFSYQTLNIIGAMGHVLVTFFLLAALLLWVEGRYRARLWLQIGAVLCAVLAGWSMEYGVIAIPLVGALEVYLRRRMDVPDRAGLQPLALLALLGIAQAIYIAIWLNVDCAESPTPAFDDVLRNAALWLQAMSYPGTRFLNLLHSGPEPLSYLVVAVLSGALILGALLVHAWLDQIRLALALLAIAILCFLPSMLMLTHDYVVDSPRLLYVAAPAIVTFWAMLGRALFADRRLTIGWQGVFVMFVVVTLIHSVSMIERRIEMFRTSESVVAGIVEIGDEHHGSPILILNAPSWFSFHSLTDQEYPLGHLGVQAIPQYVGFDGLYYAATGDAVHIESASLSPDVSGWDFAFGPHGAPVDHNHIDERLRNGYRIASITIEDDSAAVHQPGTIQPNSAASREPTAMLEEHIALQNLYWQHDGATLTVHTGWHTVQRLEGDYAIQIDGLDASGNVGLTHRDYALGGMSPPRLWQSGDLITDDVRLHNESVADIEEVRLSLVHTGDDSRLEIRDSRVQMVDEHHLIVPQGAE